MAEIEAAFRRISSYKDVMGVMVIDKDREVVRTSLDVRNPGKYCMHVWAMPWPNNSVFPNRFCGDCMSYTA